MLTLARMIAREDDAAAASGSDRRRGIRVRQHRPIKVFEPSGRRFFGGQTLDVSSTGLRIELPLWAPVGPGSPLHVHVGMSDHGSSLANRRQMIPARVVWVDRSADEQSSTLFAGVEFTSAITAHLDAA